MKYERRLSRSSFGMILSFRVFLTYSLLIYPLTLTAQLPSGFGDAEVSTGWTQAIGFTFDEAGRMYVWEKAGLIYQSQAGERPASPILDLSPEVANYHDHGLLGVALDPDFLNNGHIYLLYAVDRHHLLHYGTAAYDPTISLPKQATIGRVTRYTLDSSTSFQEVVPNSRKVLIGSEMANGIPLMHLSHGVGTLLFGADGSLLVSCGDGTTFAKAYAGGGSETFSPQGLADGIIPIKEDIGAYRAQLLSSHNGKILRIDPQTGEGLPSNPFYDAAAPASPRSRIWALGLRNPYRIDLRPNTGASDPSVGDPGVIVVGDVGSFRWEEINVVTQGGQNFGWPVYEGYLYSPEFEVLRAKNLDALNPLFGTNNCTEEYLSFHDLITEVSLQSPFFPNPCSPSTSLPSSLSLFVHQRPAIAYNHKKGNPPTRTKLGVFDSTGLATEVLMGNPAAPVKGAPFDGVCTVGGDFYTGTQFPEEYRGAYFMADLSGWIQAFYWNAQQELVEVVPFHEESGEVVHIQMHPQDECLYYLNIKEGSLRRICYGKNARPEGVLAYDKQYGTSPLTVSFHASDSRDPEGDSMTVKWHFGDGATSTEWAPIHTFIAPENTPTRYETHLEVRDAVGNIYTSQVLISINNTPPQVQISTPSDSTLYATNGLNIFPLTATVTDAEHPQEALSYKWTTHLIHDSHSHADPADTAHETLVMLEPAGCGDEDYSYLIELAVTDEAGLVGRDTVRLFPNCQPMAGELSAWEAVPEGRKIRLSWETTYEEGLARFEVERSSDGIHFEKQGEQVAVGGIGQKTTYQWMDHLSLLGENHYRLKLVRQGDGYDFSPIKMVISLPETPIYFYPNPAEEEVYIAFKDIHFLGEWKLFTPKGEILMERSWPFLGPLKSVISLREVPKGLYFYWVSDGNTIQTGKLVVR